MTKDIDREKVEKKRERNRLAAKKCRQKKIDTIESLKKTVSKLKIRNENLEHEFERYKNETKERIERLTLENSSLKNLISK